MILGMLSVAFVSDDYVRGVTVIVEYRYSIYQHVGLCFNFQVSFLIFCIQLTSAPFCSTYMQVSQSFRWNNARCGKAHVCECLS